MSTPLIITFDDFKARVEAEAPGVSTPLMQVGPLLHVYRKDAFQEEFWPAWDGIKQAYNFALPDNLFIDTEQVGNCWFITGACAHEISLAIRRAHSRDGTGPACFRADIILPNNGYMLNRVGIPSSSPMPGGHRTLIVALTDGDGTWQLYFVEPQLTYAQFTLTRVTDAVARGVLVRQCSV